MSREREHFGYAQRGAIALRSTLFFRFHVLVGMQGSKRCRLRLCGALCSLPGVQALVG